MYRDDCALNNAAAGFLLERTRSAKRRHDAVADIRRRVRQLELCHHHHHGDVNRDGGQLGPSAKIVNRNKTMARSATLQQEAVIVIIDGL
jgi:hypothetical protein